MKNTLTKILYKLISRVNPKNAYPLLSECTTCKVLLPTILTVGERNQEQCFKCYKEGKYLNSKFDWKEWRKLHPLS